MVYKNINNALKKTDGYITLQDIINQNFYHNKKGYSDLKIKNFNVLPIADVLGGRKRNEILRGLNNCIVNHVYFWAFERIIINKKGNWSYIAGQDYTHELNQIRKFLYLYA